MTLLSIFLAYALIMGVAERMIPFDFAVPGVRLGLANVVVLTALYIFSLPEIIMLVFVKCFVPAMLFGSIFSFFYSLAGSALSLAVMFILKKLFDGKISQIGISVCGAVAHNIGQLLVASAVVSSVYIFAYLPVLLVSGVITGVLTGTAAMYTVRFIKNYRYQK